MFRYRKNYLNYRKQIDLAVCPFCVPQKKSEIIEKGTHCFVIKNKYPYDLWEMRVVRDHLMIVPRRHVKEITSFNKKERAEIISLIAAYQAKDYNVYMRAVTSPQLTVPDHQHTHLIRTHRKKSFFTLLVTKPYFLFKF